MSDFLETTQRRLHDWCRDAIAAGWLPPDAEHDLDANSAETPDLLFDGDDRPLVVGLFGGTGVGKSSLLNRLADARIAEAGVERPTSRDVTLYHHVSKPLSRLPADFPVNRVRTASHESDRHRRVVWIDMPDVDSVATEHRQLVEHWLPHIDVLLYVVSPDRYRDDSGWNLVLAHGARHAWVFVINHWDRGDPVQKADFISLLEAYGFDDPMVFCTDSRPSDDAGHDDDFRDLSDTIESLSDRQLVAQFEAHGVVQRLRGLASVVADWRETLGPRDGVDAQLDRWPRLWQIAADELDARARARIPLLSATAGAPHADRPTLPILKAGGALLPNFAARLLGQAPGSSSTDSTPALAPKSDPATANDPALLDTNFRSRIDSTLDDFVNDCAQRGLRVEPLERDLSRTRSVLAAESNETLQLAVADALARPGTPVQRLLHRGVRRLATLLPLVAATWIAFRIVDGFRLGGLDPEGYLGLDFALHSAMLLGIAWLLPTLLARRIAPSHERAAARGMERGLTVAIEQIGDTLDARMRAYGERHAAQHAALDALWTADGHHVAALPPAVRRLVFEPSSSGVRASDQSSIDSTPVS